MAAVSEGAGACCRPIPARHYALVCAFGNYRPIPCCRGCSLGHGHGSCICCSRRRHIGNKSIAHKDVIFPIAALDLLQRAAITLHTQHCSCPRPWRLSAAHIPVYLHSRHSKQPPNKGASRNLPQSSRQQEDATAQLTCYWYRHGSSL